MQCSCIQCTGSCMQCDSSCIQCNGTCMQSTTMLLKFCDSKALQQDFLFFAEKPTLSDFPRLSTSVSSRSVDLSWPPVNTKEFDGNTPLTNLTVFCENSGNRPDRFSAVLLPNATEVTISGFHPGRSYLCYLTVHNKIGAGATNATLFKADEERKSSLRGPCLETDCLLVHKGCVSSRQVGVAKM